MISLFNETFIRGGGGGGQRWGEGLWRHQRSAPPVFNCTHAHVGGGLKCIQRCNFPPPLHNYMNHLPWSQPMRARVSSLCYALHNIIYRRLNGCCQFILPSPPWPKMLIPDHRSLCAHYFRNLQTPWTIYGGERFKLTPIWSHSVRIRFGSKFEKHKF